MRDKALEDLAGKAAFAKGRKTEQSGGEQKCLNLTLYTSGKGCYNFSRYTQSALQKVGDYMPNGLEITKAAIDDFKKIQKYMIIAKKENATETYAELKDEYLSLKAILQVAGVNMTDIDKIKE